MSTANDRKIPSSGTAPERAQAGPEGPKMPIDWDDLRSRLFAAHGARAAAQSGLERERLRLRGSFDGCAASVLHTYEEASRSVNPDASSNGKSGSGRVVPATGNSGTGGRG